MDQPDWHVHTLSCLEFELLHQLRVRRLFGPDLQASAVQIERFGLELVVVQRAFFALADFQNLSAIERIVGDPDLSAPALGFDMNRFASFRHLRWPRTQTGYVQDLLLSSLRANSRSLSTIISASCSKFTFGCHLRTRRALLESPNSTSTSVGLKNRGSVSTWSRQFSFNRSNTTSRNSCTE